MISNIQTTEEYTSKQGWVRIIKYDADGVSNTIQCKGLDNYSTLLDKLVSSQICEKKIPYQRVKYMKEKK
jgi:excinuclease UvrABC helicase subunit UvrB